MYLESRLEEDRAPLVLAAIFGASLLFHLLLILVGALYFYLTPGPVDHPKNNQINLKLISAPPPTAQGLESLSGSRQFVDTSESKLTSTPVATPFEGEVSTSASSTQAGQGNAALPNQTGADVRGLSLRNQDYSPETEAKPAPQSQATEQKQPKDQATPAEQIKQATSRDQLQNIPLRSTGVVNVSDKPKNPVDKKAQEATSSTPNTTSSQAMAPATFSAQKRATTINGGAGIGDNSSIAAQESEMGRYKAKLYRAIGSRWYIYIREDSAQVSVGKVVIRFKVSSSGEISDLQVIEGSAYAPLQAVSRRSILELRGQLDPFPASMQEQLGDFYWEEVTFTIY